MSLACYNSYLEVDTNIFRNNIHSILSSLPPGTKLIPVLKGDAYGFGAVRMARELSDFGEIDCIAVAQIGEGIELRKNGVEKDILVLGAFPLFQLPLAVEYGLQLTVFTPGLALAVEKEAARQGKTVGIHIKIETGLNRIGVKPGADLDKLLDTLKTLSRLKLCGVFSHFVDGEVFGSALAKKQLGLYLGAVEQIKAAGFEVPLRHICNSGASDWFEDAYLDAVRIGRRLYMDSRDNPGGTLGEVGSWRTGIMNLHSVDAGESVGYDGVFTAERPTVVATVCIGYGDGLFPGFAEAKCSCLINGKRAPYIGICMDQCFVDVTDIDCAVGDEVTVFGRASDGSFLSAQELGRAVSHEGVFFTDTLSPRVERRYI